MIPVSFDCHQYHHPSIVITLNGNKVQRCFCFNEAEGWVDVHLSDSENKVIRLQGGGIAQARLYGVVRAECPPEIRTIIEKRFAVQAKEQNVS